MVEVRWKLDEVLSRHGLTPADVEREVIRLGYKWGAKTIYRFTGPGPKLVSRESLAVLLRALRSLTGKRLAVADLLEYVEVQ